MRPADGHLIETGCRCAAAGPRPHGEAGGRGAAVRTGSQVETAKPSSGPFPAEQAAFKSSMLFHGRADARPSRSAEGAGNEGTGHALPAGLRGFSDVAVQI